MFHYQRIGLVLHVLLTCDVKNIKMTTLDLTYK